MPGSVRGVPGNRYSYRDHCGGRIDLFKVGGGQKAASELEVPFLGRIPIDPLVVEKCDSGHPFVTDSVESEAKEAFIEVTQKVLDALEPSREKAAYEVHESLRPLPTTMESR